MEMGKVAASLLAPVRISVNLPDFVVHKATVALISTNVNMITPPLKMVVMVNTATLIVQRRCAKWNATINMTRLVNKRET